ncbi:hypothetical protein AX016_3326 [Cellulophaga sp. RHA19]|uniref:hypothetical protein n=1 Tax=Cellulophaga sp. RHA19 TaxID=1798237 RepID=UPI000C2BB1FB|nr:hypothetical protein [Cellulophaga sp. RHA19]PKB45088.1 hypothetical protein AX016_3326 [Cellulophaga sp. RHA19]
MKEHSKEFNDIAEFKKASFSFREYQKRHNIIRKDFELLLKITEENINDSEKFNTLYRASLKGILSLIESGIFGLNEIDKYKDYKDNDCFQDKFKKTFKQICKTWGKDEIFKKYLDSKYGNLKKIKGKRDKLIHPKNSKDIIIATKVEFDILKNVFYDYTSMIHSLMDNFFIEMEFKDTNEIIDSFKK